jgi:hypothetical protein
MLALEVTMRSQPTRSRGAAGGAYASSLAPVEWALLVRLPARLLAAVLAVRPEPPQVHEGLAGVAVIAAGRTAASRLVREVVAAIYASDDAPGMPPTSPEAPEAVLAECAAAGLVLADRVPAGDAAGYRRWVLRAAECPSVGVWDADGGIDDPAGAATRRLLVVCERALAG